MNRIIPLLCLLLVTNYTFASNDVVNTETRNTPSQNTVIETGYIGTAKDWELTEIEWRQYLHLMKGPSRHYYKNLSPPEVLGIQASNKEDLRHFAEIAAKLEHDRLERELRFNAAFHDAALKLYPTELLIQPFDYTPFTPIPKR